MSICMKKKNTLLYLDEILVNEAKKRKVNISKITEDALKHYLFQTMSDEEEKSIDFGPFLQNLREEKRCFFLPFELKSLHVVNIGTIKMLHTQLKKINLFVGDSNTGKTTLIRCITHMFSLAEPNIEQLLGTFANVSGIYLDVIPENPLTLKLVKRKNGAPSKEETMKCILLDDPGIGLNKETYKMLLNYLRRLDKQIIMTTTPRPEIQTERRFKDSKIFDMNVFKRK